MISIADVYGVRNRGNGFVNVVQSSLALEKTSEPMRQHLKKPWMSVSYHARIQKKWNRRFGFVMRPCAFKTPNGWIVHPSIIAKMKNELRDAGIISVNDMVS